MRCSSVLVFSWWFHSYRLWPFQNFFDKILVMETLMFFSYFWKTWNFICTENITWSGSHFLFQPFSSTMVHFVISVLFISYLSPSSIIYFLDFSPNLVNFRILEFPYFWRKNCIHKIQKIGLSCKNLLFLRFFHLFEKCSIGFRDSEAPPPLALFRDDFWEKLLATTMISFANCCEL